MPEQSKRSLLGLPVPLPHLFAKSFVLVPPPGTGEQADGNDKDDYLRERFSRSKNQEKQDYPNQDRRSGRKVVFAERAKEVFDLIHELIRCFYFAQYAAVDVNVYMISVVHKRIMCGQLAVARRMVHCWVRMPTPGALQSRQSTGYWGDFLICRPKSNPVKGARTMKTVVSLLLALGCCTLPFHARCDDHESGDDTGGGSGEGSSGSCTNADQLPCGGQIDGSESLIATVTLTPTENAPAGAAGVATIVSLNQDGVVTNECTVTTTGLPSGTYTLSAVRKSDASTLILGDIIINADGICHGGDDQEENEQEDQNHHGDGNDGGDQEKRGRTNHSGVNANLSTVELPPELDPLDIAQLILSDANGTALLVGDFVNPVATSSIKYKAVINIHGTTKGTKGGRAQALTTSKKGKRKDRFAMIASGVAPNTALKVYVNGQAVGTAKSNKKGKVLVKKLPVNLLSVRTVRLVDDTGQTAASTKF